MEKTLKEAFKKQLESAATTDSNLPETLENMSMADLIAMATVRKAVRKPSSGDVLNIAKISGELTDTVNVNVTPIDEALKDCKQ